MSGIKEDRKKVFNQVKTRIDKKVKEREIEKKSKINNKRNVPK